MKTQKVTEQTKKNGSSKEKKLIAAKQNKPEKKDKKSTAEKAKQTGSLKRVLVFLSESDLSLLKKKVGEGKVSTKIRELVKAYLSK